MPLRSVCVVVGRTDMVNVRIILAVKLRAKKRNTNNSLQEILYFAKEGSFKEYSHKDLSFISEERGWKD